MTREEAIRLIGWLKCTTNREDDLEAIDMAIESLSQPIVAKHFDIESGYIYCSPQIAENVKVVVRCKDCRYAQYDATHYFCAEHHHKVYEDDYCSHGQRLSNFGERAEQTEKGGDEMTAEVCGDNRFEIIERAKRKHTPQTAEDGDAEKIVPIASVVWRKDTMAHGSILTQDLREKGERMIHQLNMQGKDKVQVAIDRLKTFEPPEGYYLAFSGGKDSVVIKALADMAGVKYDAHYNLTSVDPPELVQFIKTFDDVQIDRPKDKDGKQVTMWNLIPSKKMPPTRIVRYCCKHLKEMGGQGRLVITGVRWAESPNRKNNQGEITVMTPKKKEREDMIQSGNFIQTDKGGVVLNNDNEESRKMVEQCYKQSKTVVNPIIDWSTDEVWEFIKEYHIPYCKLYDEGYKRLGCIGCPMGTNESRIKDFERYPKYKQAYIRAFDRMIANYSSGGGTHGNKELMYSDGMPKENMRWKNSKELMEWWIK